MKSRLEVPCRWFVLAVLLLALASGGCLNVAKNGSLLAENVSVGIQRMQADTEKIIHALAEVERGELDDQWDAFIYPRAEELYRKDQGIGEDAALTQDQRIDIATIAMEVFLDIEGDIAAKEKLLIDQTRLNAQRVIEINDKVKQYLLSQEQYEESKQRIADMLKETFGVDPSQLVGTASKGIKKALGIQ